MANAMPDLWIPETTGNVKNGAMVGGAKISKDCDKSLITNTVFFFCYICQHHDKL